MAVVVAVANPHQDPGRIVVVLIDSPVRRDQQGLLVVALDQ